MKLSMVMEKMRYSAGNVTDNHEIARANGIIIKPNLKENEKSLYSHKNVSKRYKSR
jgi:hypothetical protein